MAHKRLSLRTRAILLVSIFMLVTNLALGAVLMHQVRTVTKTQINEHMLDVVNTAAAMLDGDVLAALTAEDEGTPAYQEVYATLSRFLDNINLDYIYYVRDMGDGTFTFGIDPDPVAPGEFGSPVVYTDALYAASRGTPAVDEKPYEDEWGRFYSAFSPVFDSAGKVAGVVTADFDATWYEDVLRHSEQTILIACAVLLAISIAITFFLTGQYRHEMQTIKNNLSDLAGDLASLSKEYAVNSMAPVPDVQSDDICALGKQIAELRNSLRDYTTHTTTQANAMITAMAADYSSVYYANLDTDDCVCYRADYSAQRPFNEGDHFSYRELFERYARNSVTDAYREGFLHFIEPDNVRAALATQPLIAYRYLAHRNGRDFYEMIRMAGVRRAEDRDDHIVHAVGVGLTKIDDEMREAMAKNQTLAEALSMAESANVAKTAFLSNMSHEIRTPMNAVIGLNNLALRDETLTEQTRDYLTKTGESAKHLLSLINDILDMSRIESGRIVLRQEAFSFRGMLEQINTMVMSQCGDKGLHYECRVLGDVDDSYIGDDMKLKEVLINILSNAIKFTEAPGSVTLTVERTAQFEDQSTLRFRVRDTGIGMDKEYLPKIFEAFSQEDSSRKNKYSSTGLGMAITKSIVEMMNGTISVESEKGVGTEFTVVIPLRNAARSDAAPEAAADPGIPQVPAADAAESPAQRASLAGRRILLAEDTDINAEIMMDILSLEDAEADRAENGKIAVEMFASGAPGTYAAILMDVRMPVMDGLEAAAAIRALDRPDAKRIPIIALTANAFDEDVQRSLQAGMNAHLSKPVDSERLFQTLGELICEAESEQSV